MNSASRSSDAASRSAAPRSAEDEEGPDGQARKTAQAHRQNP